MGAQISTLVVDDNEGFRSGLVTYLRTIKEINVIAEAKDGREAVALTRMLSPELVLMDVSMPGMGGLEAARIIKEEHQETKVVLVTIHEEETYRRLANLVHADGFVCKSAVKHDLPIVLGKIRADLRH